VRKTNPRHRWHLTDAEKEEIRSLTLAGVRQAEIARKMRIGRDTVGTWQVRMGLPTVPPIPEKKILELFRRGWGGYRISKHLRVPANQVYAVAHRNNFRRVDGIGYPEPHGDVAGFIEALKRREGYVKTLAKKYGVGFCQAGKIAHEVLACPEFRPGASKPPLSSNFPQKHFDAKLAGPDEFVTLVQCVLQKCFDGKFPLGREHDAKFVAAILLTCQTFLGGQSPEVVDRCAMGLTVAVDCVRRQRETRWQN
jgi:hypothetical protein